MAELYNTTFMEYVTNPVDLLVGIGTAMGKPYLIGELILLAFFFVFLILSLKMNFLEVLLIDCFIVTILAVLFFIAELIPAVVIVYPFVLFILVLLFYLFS